MREWDRASGWEQAWVVAVLGLCGIGMVLGPYSLLTDRLEVVMTSWAVTAISAVIVLSYLVVRHHRERVSSTGGEE